MELAQKEPQHDLVVHVEAIVYPSVQKGRMGRGV